MFPEGKVFEEVVRTLGNSPQEAQEEQLQLRIVVGFIDIGYRLTVVEERYGRRALGKQEVLGVVVERREHSLALFTDQVRVINSDRGALRKYTVGGGNDLRRAQRVDLVEAARDDMRPY